MNGAEIVDGGADLNVGVANYLFDVIYITIFCQSVFHRAGRSPAG